MRLPRKLAALAGALLLAIGGSAFAQTIYSDNFDADPVGLSALPAGWTITRGSVDVIGPANFDLQPGHGNYVDLDGTSDVAALMSTGPFALNTGTSYTLSMLLAGSQRGDTN